MFWTALISEPFATIARGTLLQAAYFYYNVANLGRSKRVRRISLECVSRGWHFLAYCHSFFDLSE